MIRTHNLIIYWNVKLTVLVNNKTTITKFSSMMFDVSLYKKKRLDHQEIFRIHQVGWFIIPKNCILSYSHDRNYMRNITQHRLVRCMLLSLTLFICTSTGV